VSRAIVTHAAGAHEELLDVAIPTFQVFAERHEYELLVTRGDIKESRRFLVKPSERIPPAWCKVPLLLDALERYDEVVWFDCDLVVVDPSEDFPPMGPHKTHALVRHFEDNSEVPNSGVWRVTKDTEPLLRDMMKLEVFRNHGWWEQAALMTLMGYCVPPEGSHFPDTKCANKYQTTWYDQCHFMRLCWNSHPNYRADHPRVVHCSYPQMSERLEVMRELVCDPRYDYPRYGDEPESEKETKQ
jgi:hypothetical protein